MRTLQGVRTHPTLSSLGLNFFLFFFFFTNYFEIVLPRSTTSSLPSMAVILARRLPLPRSMRLRTTFLTRLLASPPLSCSPLVPRTLLLSTLARGPLRTWPDLSRRTVSTRWMPMLPRTRRSPKAKHLLLARLRLLLMTRTTMSCKQYRIVM